MIIPSALEEKILDASSDAMADYNRAVILYQHHVVTKKELIGITNTISVNLINVVESINEIKGGDNDD